jgi:hypothetical protein
MERSRRQPTYFLKITAFWDIAPRGLVGVDRRFRGVTNNNITFLEVSSVKTLNTIPLFARRNWGNVINSLSVTLATYWHHKRQIISWPTALKQYFENNTCVRNLSLKSQSLPSSYLIISHYMIQRQIHFIFKYSLPKCTLYVSVVTDKQYDNTIGMTLRKPTHMHLLDLQGLLDHSLNLKKKSISSHHLLQQSHAPCSLNSYCIIIV